MSRKPAPGNEIGGTQSEKLNFQCKQAGGACLRREEKRRGREREISGPLVSWPFKDRSNSLSFLMKLEAKNHQAMEKIEIRSNNMIILWSLCYD